MRVKHKRAKISPVIPNASINRNIELSPVLSVLSVEKFDSRAENQKKIFKFI